MTATVQIDLSSAIQEHAGIGRYSEELARALVDLPSDLDVSLFYVDSRGRLPRPPLDKLPCRSLRWGNKMWRLSVLLAVLARAPMDGLLHSPELFHATDNLLPPLRRTQSVFTLFDLSFIAHPETHLPMNRFYLRLMVPAFLHRAAAVIAISNFTKEDAISTYGLDDSKVTVIPLGVGPSFHPVSDKDQLSALRARYALPESFILYVGTLEPRKNLETLWEVLKTVRARGRDEKLVVVGRKGWRYKGTLLRLKEMGMDGEVIFPGYVPDEELPIFYSLASCLCFPSLYEGFGLPPLEAMASGCPVICSNTSSLPEVCGDAAVLVPPKDVAGWAQALERALGDEHLSSSLRARGFKQASRFTWQETARKTLSVYRQALEDSRDQPRSKVSSNKRS